MLRYALSGEIPPEPALAVQATRLMPLMRMLELDGFRCANTAVVQGGGVPLLVEKNGERVAVGIQSGLLDSMWKDHSLKRLIDANVLNGRVLNDFVLRRTLPDEHQLVRDMFD